MPAFFMVICIEMVYTVICKNSTTYLKIVAITKYAYVLCVPLCLNPEQIHSCPEVLLRWHSGNDTNMIVQGKQR